MNIRDQYKYFPALLLFNHPMQRPSILQHNNNRLWQHNIRRMKNNILLPVFEVVVEHTLVVAVVDSIPAVVLVGNILVVVLVEVRPADNMTRLC